MQPRLIRLAGLAALSFLASTAALAQEAQNATPSGLGFGLKGGVGNDPAQVVLGAQWALNPRRIKLFRVVPNVHFGFGDETTTDLNVDLLLRVPTGRGFAIYGGGTPTVTVPSSGDSDLGGTWLVGMQLPVLKNRATTLETRFGTGGAPKFRLMATVVF